MSLRFLLGIVAVQLTSSAAGAQKAPLDSLAALLERAWSTARASHVVPGAAIAVVRDGRVVALRGFGFARLEDSVPADPERSVYRLASVAKLFVAAAVMQRVDSGRLALDRAVTELAPGVVLPRGEGSITLRQLLTHTAGFDERVIGYAAPTRAAMRPLGDYLDARLPDRGWPAGALVSYSNHGMALAAYVAEAEAGVGFDQLAARSMFAPLGMSRTWYVAPGDSALEHDVAPGYRCGTGGCERAPVLWSHAYPVGLAYSTASDMGRFMIAMLQSPTLTKRQFTHDAWLPGIGFAFLEHSVRGNRVVSHAGGVPGTATVLALVPDEGLGVFIATNAGEPGFTASMLRQVFDALLPDRSEPAPVPTGRVDEYAGAYRLARISHRTVERFPGVFAFTLRAWSRGDTLLLSTGSTPRRFVRVDSLRLREVGGDARAVFRRDGTGRITQLYTGVPAGGSEIPGALERVPWYEVPYFLNEYASWLVLAPLLVWVSWMLIAVGFLMRRRIRREPSRTRVNVRATRAVGLGLLHAVATLLFFFGFVAASGRELSSGSGLAFGMSTGKLVLLRLAWLLAIAAAPMVWYAIKAWQEKWWAIYGRLSYTIIATDALLTAHFLVWWNYLPGRW